MQEIDNLLKVIDKIKEQENQINSLKNEVSKMRNFINSTPQLSQTALGRSTSNGKITYRNWWIGWKSEYDGILDEYWFSRFVFHHWPNENYKLNFFSVWNNHCNIKEKFEGKKIFYSSECLNIRFKEFIDSYGTYAIDYVDLAIGNDYIDNPKYLRFPYWLFTIFNPESSSEDIKEKIEEIVNSNFEKTDDVALINSHDHWNTRRIITDDVEKYVNITYAGKWRRNTNELQDKYNNNKFEYLKKFKFNICAENVVDEGYVTEKIFDALKADCIPLYVGGKGDIEPKVLNEDAILRWYPGEDNSDTLELFQNILTDEKSYLEFKNQNPLLDSAPKIAIKKFLELKKHMEKLIYD